LLDARHVPASFREHPKNVGMNIVATSPHSMPPITRTPIDRRAAAPHAVRAPRPHAETNASEVMTIGPEAHAGRFSAASIGESPFACSCAA